MPDPNKLRALRDAGFKIVPTCATCVFYRRGSRAAWGRCTAIAHDHEKHGSRSETGVPDNGLCPRYELNETELYDWAQSYRAFYEEGAEELSDGA